MARTPVTLSAEIESAFKVRFKTIGEKITGLTELAERIQAGLEEKEEMLGQKYAVTFAVHPNNPDCPKTDPVELLLKTAHGELLCAIDMEGYHEPYVLKINSEVIPNADNLEEGWGLEEGKKADEILGFLSTLLASEAARRNYARNIDSTGYQKFIPKQL